MAVAVLCLTNRCTGLLIQPRDAILHILEADVGVHIGGRRRRRMAELFLDQPEVAGLLEQLNRYRVWDKPEEAREWRAKLPQTEAARQ